MDDSSLKSLIIKSNGILIQLTPSFSKTIKLYNAIIESVIESINVTTQCSEIDAFCQVKNVSKDGKIVMKEGENQVIVQVDAADQSKSIYTIKVIKPSDVSLRSIDVSAGRLVPNFDTAERNYTLLVSSTQETVSIVPHALNPKAIVVNNEIPKLHGGDTIFEFTATSADSTKKEKYVVVVRKEKISFRVHVQSESGIEATTILCKLCKMIPFCPRMSKGQQEFGYCLTCLKLLIDCNNKSSNFVVDPLPLKAVDNLSEVCLESNSQMESIIDGLLVKCPYSLFGCSLVCSNLLMATHANGCPYKLTKKEPDTSTCIDCGKLYVTAEKLFHNERCLSKNTAPRLTITKTNVSKWETALINIEKYKYTPDAALSKNNKDMEAYAYNLNQCYDHYKENEGNGTIRPNIDLLSDAMKTLATTIGSANSNNNNAAELHYQLGLLKEESDLVNLIFPLIEVSSVDDNLKNKEAGNSFMADEVDGLLMQLAVAPTASNISKLKALEGEYQRLKSNSQTNEATEVQGLYQWLLKKTNGTSDGSDAPKQEKVLQISTEKYKDCLLINPNHLEANIYLGRSLLFKGEFDEAQSFLAYAVAINPLHQLSKFYLAIQTIKAAFIKKSKHGLLEAITYLENYISSLSFGDHLIPSMITNDNLRRTNGFVVEGLFTLANGYKMQTKFKEAESVILDILYTIPTELISSPKKGESFRTLVRQFCQAQCDLHDLSFFIESRRSELLESNLIALIEIFECHKAFTACGSNLAEIKNHAAKSLVFKYPTCSSYLTTLGQNQLDMFESTQDIDMLQEAFISFTSAIKAETDSEPNQDLVTGKWYLEFEASIKSLVAVQLEALKVIKGKETTGSVSKAAIKGGVIFTSKNTSKNGAIASPSEIINKIAPNSKILSTKAKSKVEPSKTITASVPINIKGGAVPKLKDNSPITEKASLTAPNNISNKANSKEASITSFIKTNKPKELGNTTTVIKTSIKQPSSQKQMAPAIVAQKNVPCKTENKEITVSQKAESNSAEKKPKYPPEYFKYKSRLGLARVIVRQKSTGWEEKMKMEYLEAMKCNPKDHDAYIELGELLEKNEIEAAINVYKAFEYEKEPTQNDLYLHGELSRLLMKKKAYGDPFLLTSLIAQGKGMGIKTLQSTIDILDAASQGKLLMQLYAGVNGKPIDDPQLLIFFKSRYWL